MPVPARIQGRPQNCLSRFFRIFFFNHHFSPSHNLTHKKPSNLKNEKTDFDDLKIDVFTRRLFNKLALQIFLLMEKLYVRNTKQQQQQ